MERTKTKRRYLQTRSLTQTVCADPDKFCANGILLIIFKFIRFLLKHIKKTFKESKACVSYPSLSDVSSKSQAKARLLFAHRLCTTSIIIRTASIKHNWRHWKLCYLYYGKKVFNIVANNYLTRQSDNFDLPHELASV